VSERIEIRVPDIGDFSDVPVIEVLVGAGDQVAADESLLTLESDKATMEVPAPASGVVLEITIGVGDTVSEGDLVAVLEADAADQPEPEEAEAAEPPEADIPPDPESTHKKPAETKPAEPPATSRPAPPDAGPRQSPPAPLGADATLPDRVPYASPAIRSFARELGVDLFRVSGSGRNGRILREDVTAFVKSVMTGAAPSGGLAFDLPEPPEIDFSKFGEIERQQLPRIRRISGKNLHRNWLSIPHVTHNDLADITEMEQFRRANKDEVAAQGFKLTPLVFLIRACVSALQAHPQFNASLDIDGERLVLKKYFNIGIAVDTADGLVVPVIRDCDRKSVLDLARELSEVSQRARDRKLTPQDWQGAGFTISSLGGIGGTSFNPIINAPEVAILGVSRSRMEPVWDGGAFQPRLMLPLSLSYDHRVIDGAAAARFTRSLAEYLEDAANLGLE
jgi:pyruvate dehydrogenase E2 component (dihydrolipoamide acetyltransferase)